MIWTAHALYTSICHLVKVYNSGPTYRNKGKAISNNEGNMFKELLALSLALDIY